MRYLSRALLAGGLGLAAAFLVACGANSGLLSASESSSLQGELTTASADIANHDCVSANKVIGNLETQIANLPGSVDPTLVNDLSRGAQTVRDLAKTQCTGTVGTATHTTTSTPTQTTTHPRTTPTSTSTSTTTTSTSTTPTNTTTTSTQTVPTTPSTPATSTPTPGTSNTGNSGGGGAPTGDSGQGQGNGQGN